MGAALRGDWWRDAVAALLLLGIGIGLVLLFYLSSGAEFVAGALYRVRDAGVDLILNSPVTRPSDCHLLPL